MTRLDNLISDLCPYGVEHIRLSDAVTISRGTRVVRSQLTTDAPYPVYQNSLTPLGYFSKSNCSSDTVFIIMAGAAGEIGYSEKPFWAADDCYYLLPDSNLLSRFLYHFLLNVRPLILSHVRKASVPRLSRKAIENLIVPVPPLEVQQEIVWILDRFTQLIAELTAELTARKEQYKYYRDRVLTKQSETSVYTIKQLCKVSRGRVISKDYIRDNPGPYPVYSSQTENEGVLGFVNSYEYDGEYLTWTTDGANAGTVFHRKGKFNITNVCGLLIPNRELVLPRYLYYALEKVARNYVNQGMGNPKLMSNVMSSIKLLIPPLEVQNRIVSILDRFDALCNDLTSGLPAEIAARQKQYEYYRDKLLTFKERET